MQVSEQEFQRLVAHDPDNRWELDCGVVRRKPPVTYRHNHVAWVLGFRLQSQLPLEEFEVRVDAGHIRRSPTHYFIPDVMVAPHALTLPLRDDRAALESYDAPLPLIVEVWSRSTGEFDQDTKLPFYQQRGHREIWFLHPDDRTLTAYRRVQDGSYVTTVYRGGTITPVTLPGVAIDLDTLFE